MKKIIGLIAICLGMMIPAVAQECSAEGKLALYNEFRANFKSDTAKANELAKKWLACPEAAGDEQISAYLKNFVTLYEKANRKDRVTDLVYNKKDYAKAFEIGKAVLVDEPENLKVLIDLAYAGWDSKGDTYQADTLTFARKAIQLIEAGKAPESWIPYSNKEEALGYLYNTLATRTVAKNPADALPNLIRAAQFEGRIKKLPLTYALIAGAYNDGPYATLTADYEAKFKGKDETPESKLALENINQIMDRMIDALARAVALAGNEPANQASKKAWMETLTGWYKFRHNQTDTGLTEMIASILSKPLPPQPTPITSLPAAAPAASPTSGTVNAAGSTAGNTPTGTASATQPGSTANSSTTPATGTPAKTKPAGSAKTATPPKPKTKRNHRRH
ncbi:MAG: hypothetical protein ACREBG_02695 [Pyrinomonadaceae bacterium]